MHLKIKQSPFGFLLQDSDEIFPNLNLENKYFNEALIESIKAVGRTCPNPPVGAVIVKDGVIVGRGFTGLVGGNHAEVNAIVDAGANAKGGTLYTTMEPCHHFGRTPPCTDGIIKAGLKRVVIGIKDPNPQINGSGIAVLKKAGVEVVLKEQDYLTKQIETVISPFKKNILHNKPWVICKIATSLDGCVTSKIGQQTIVTSDESRRLVHELRNVVDAVMVGTNTIDIDNPELNVRLKNVDNIRDPLRIILDSSLKSATDSKVYDKRSAARTYVLHTEFATAEKVEAFSRSGINLIKVDSKNTRVELEQALKLVSGLGVTSILVECGPQLLMSFLVEELFDEIWWFVSSKIFGKNGIKSVDFPISEGFATNIVWQTPIIVGQDVLFIGRREEN
ncbi:MAG: bifunctional diaminohydroxyphosphoribosylaminopyrimidine deaminase/5-amino-6-(5-phosphoribosylamino)uracil reductase RibD [bacterium]|nr:bifunctional diaminohydroxyphosphoribosylaminopyrimidine deaminase/5-amino-6-(5-phosphoribosylamino)uracil reductase RibD [bacterium]